MIANAFNTLLYEPFYNGLIFLISRVPGGNVGVAVILLTLAVKFILFFLSYRSTKSQASLKEKMVDLEPEIARLKKQYAGNRSEQSAKILELYRVRGVNPLAGLASIFTLLVQIPVILALYFVFLRGGLPDISPDLLYVFIGTPDTVNMGFLGIANVSDKSLSLAVVTGVTQFLHAYIMFPASKKGGKEELSIRADFARSMQINMKYAFPVVIGFIAYSLSAAVAIYWITSNIFAIGQDLYIKRRVASEKN